MKLSDVDFVLEHLNSLNTIVTQLISVGVQMDEEDYCITLLCSFPNSWDNLVMAIGSTIKALVLDEIMVSLVSMEVRQNNSKSTII